MKLLLDENLSPKLAQSLTDLFPGSQHVFHIFPAGADDSDIWNYATANGMAIVSKDTDFAERSVLQGGETKVIWIRIGNCLTSEIDKLVRANFPAIQKFLEQSVETCLVLNHQMPKSRL